MDITAAVEVCVVAVVGSKVAAEEEVEVDEEELLGALEVEI